MKKDSGEISNENDLKMNIRCDSSNHRFVDDFTNNESPLQNDSNFHQNVLSMENMPKVGLAELNSSVVENSESSPGKLSLTTNISEDSVNGNLELDMGTIKIINSSGFIGKRTDSHNKFNTSFVGRNVGVGLQRMQPLSEIIKVPEEVREVILHWVIKGQIVHKTDSLIFVRLNVIDKLLGLSPSECKYSLIVGRAMSVSGPKHLTDDEMTALSTSPVDSPEHSQFTAMIDIVTKCIRAAEYVNGEYKLIADQATLSKKRRGSQPGRCAKRPKPPVPIEIDQSPHKQEQEEDDDDEQSYPDHETKSIDRDSVTNNVMKSPLPQPSELIVNETETVDDSALVSRLSLNRSFIAGGNNRIKNVVFANKEIAQVIKPTDNTYTSCEAINCAVGQSIRVRLVSHYQPKLFHEFESERKQFLLNTALFVTVVQIYDNCVVLRYHVFGLYLWCNFAMYSKVCVEGSRFYINMVSSKTLCELRDSPVDSDQHKQFQSYRDILLQCTRLVTEQITASPMNPSDVKLSRMQVAQPVYYRLGALYKSSIMKEMSERDIEILCNTTLTAIVHSKHIDCVMIHIAVLDVYLRVNSSDCWSFLFSFQRHQLAHKERILSDVDVTQLQSALEGTVEHTLYRRLGELLRGSKNHIILTSIESYVPRQLNKVQSVEKRTIKPVDVLPSSSQASATVTLPSLGNTVKIELYSHPEVVVTEDPVDDSELISRLVIDKPFANTKPLSAVFGPAAPITPPPAATTAVLEREPSDSQQRNGSLPEDAAVDSVVHSTVHADVDTLKLNEVGSNGRLAITSVAARRIMPFRYVLGQVVLVRLTGLFPREVQIRLLDQSHTTLIDETVLLATVRHICDDCIVVRLQVFGLYFWLSRETCAYHVSVVDDRNWSMWLPQCIPVDKLQTMRESDFDSVENKPFNLLNDVLKLSKRHILDSLTSNMTSDAAKKIQGLFPSQQVYFRLRCLYVASELSALPELERTLINNVTIMATIISKHSDGVVIFCPVFDMYFHLSLRQTGFCILVFKSFLVEPTERILLIPQLEAMRAATQSSSSSTQSEWGVFVRLLSESRLLLSEEEAMTYTPPVIVPPPPLPVPPVGVDSDVDETDGAGVVELTSSEPVSAEQMTVDASSQRKVDGFLECQFVYFRIRGLFPSRELRDKDEPDKSLCRNTVIVASICSKHDDFVIIHCPVLDLFFQLTIETAANRLFDLNTFELQSDGELIYRSELEVMQCAPIDSPLHNKFKHILRLMSESSSHLSRDEAFSHIMPDFVPIHDEENKFANFVEGQQLMMRMKWLYNRHVRKDRLRQEQRDLLDSTSIMVTVTEKTLTRVVVHSSVLDLSFYFLAQKPMCGGSLYVLPYCHHSFSRTLIDNDDLVTLQHSPVDSAEHNQYQSIRSLLVGSKQCTTSTMRLSTDNRELHRHQQQPVVDLPARVVKVTQKEINDKIRAEKQQAKKEQRETEERKKSLRKVNTLSNKLKADTQVKAVQPAVKQKYKTTNKKQATSPNKKTASKNVSKLSKLLPSTVDVDALVESLAADFSDDDDSDLHSEEDLRSVGGGGGGGDLMSDDDISLVSVLQPSVFTIKRKHVDTTAVVNNKKSKPTVSRSIAVVQPRVMVSHRLIPDLPVVVTKKQKIVKPVTVTTDTQDVVPVQPGDVVFVDLRTWGADWYASLALPKKDTVTYVVKCVYGELCDKKPLVASHIKAHYPVFDETYTIGARDVRAYGMQTELMPGQVLVSEYVVKTFKLKEGR